MLVLFFSYHNNKKPNTTSTNDHFCGSLNFVKIAYFVTVYSSWYYVRWVLVTTTDVMLVLNSMSQIFVTGPSNKEHMRQWTFFFLNQQSECKVIYKLMCWLSGSLTCRLPNVTRSPTARISLVSSIIVDWCLAPRRWGFYLKSRSTNYPDHGHHVDPPPQGKCPW